MNHYQFIVVSYVHDNAVGERLNFGIILVDAQGELFWAVDHSTARLTGAFRGFNADQHREICAGLESGLLRIKSKLQGFAEDEALAERTLAEVKNFWPDDGLNYRFSEPKPGLTNDVEPTLSKLFKQFVASDLPSELTRSAG